MRSTWTRRFLLAALVLALAGSADAQSFAWWKSEQLQKELGLTPEQCAQIEAVVKSTLPTLRQGKADLDKQEAELSRLIETNADEALVVRQIDRVEAIRAFLNKTRTLMLLRERQIMRPDQRVAFKAAYEKGVQERRRQHSDGDHRQDGDRRRVPDQDRREP